MAHFINKSSGNEIMLYDLTIRKGISKPTL